MKVRGDLTLSKERLKEIKKEFTKAHNEIKSVINTSTTVRGNPINLAAKKRIL